MVLSRNYCCGCCLIFFRKLYVYSVLRTNHYKTLGLSPSATQSEIKSAYYELSKKHHPDKNQGSEKSAKIFRSITAAYEILGNEKLRKKYDDSHPWSLVDESSTFDAAPKGDYNDDVERMYYERRQRRFHRRYYYGKTPYYDFDAWYKAHYGKNSYYDAHTWLRSTHGKNLYSEYEEWCKNQYQRNNSFTNKDGTFKSYRHSSETVKKQDAFIKKAESTFIIVFYITLIVTLLSRI